jgi:hypothetical protein
VGRPSRRTVERLVRSFRVNLPRSASSRLVGAFRLQHASVLSGAPTRDGARSQRGQPGVFLLEGALLGVLGSARFAWLGILAKARSSRSAAPPPSSYFPPRALSP